MSTVWVALGAILISTLATAQDDGVFNKVLLPGAVASHNARCLDGSAPGYFIRTPATPSNQWVIHAQGGGWCWNEDECLSRSTSGLGSSTQWPNTSTCYGECDGILSGNHTTNPDFYSWNAVFVGYCDGGSFTGAAVAPLAWKGKELWFRGRAILTAVIEALQASGMANATDVVFTGGSAGGLTAYLQGDFAGFFLDHPTTSGTPLIRSEFTYMSQMMASSLGTNAACVAANAGAEWRCVFAQYVIPFVQSPVFILEGAPGLKNHGFTLYGQDMHTCSAAQNVSFQDYGATMRSTIAAVLATGGDTLGAFVPACIVHCESVYNEGEDRWGVWTINGVTPRAAFASWYLGKAGPRVVIEQCDYPCNPICPVFT